MALWVESEQIISKYNLETYLIPQKNHVDVSEDFAGLCFDGEVISKYFTKEMVD